MITTALTISLIILGVYLSTRDDMIFGKLRAWLQTKMDKVFGVKVSDWLQKPLFECCYCMASVWTLVLSPYFSISWYDIPIMILVVCGINVVLGGVLKYLEL